VHEAQDQLGEALKIDPNAPHAQNNLAFGQAMLAQTAAGTPQRTEYDVAFERGMALFDRGDGNRAAAAFRQALDLQPRSITARVYLGLALLRAQRGKDAAAALREAKAIDVKQANDVVTRALRMPPAPDNIDIIITQASSQ
jgi:Flp pilus assembly protein TadD